MKYFLQNFIEQKIEEKAAKIACLKCDEVSTAAAWQKKGGYCPKCKVSNQGVAESVKLEEKVEIDHSRYVRSHGKKARDTFGGEGTWAFTDKDRGDVDYKDDKEVFTYSGKFADAQKAAKQWGKKHGHREVYVMEEVELDESRLLEKYNTFAMGSESVKLEEQLSSTKGEANEINGKKYIGKNLLWDGKKIAEVYAHTSSSQSKRTGSKIATYQKKVVRWGYRLIGVQSGRYDVTTDYSSRDEAQEAAVKAYKKANGLYEKGLSATEIKSNPRIKATEEFELTEDVHNDLNDVIIDFQKKLMRMNRQLDPAIAKEVKAIDKKLDDLRTGSLFKIRPGR